MRSSADPEIGGISLVDAGFNLNGSGGQAAVLIYVAMPGIYRGDR